MNRGNPERLPGRLNIEAGLTLVELLIAMVLGLIVIGGVISVILSNSQTYRSNQALGQLQEGTRTAFEILGRETRQAAAPGCGTTDRIANTLNAGTRWWQDWVGIQGYSGGTVAPAVAFGTATGTRIAGTDAIFLQGLDDDVLSVKEHDIASATLESNPTAANLAKGDILMVCDFDHAAIFQAMSYVKDSDTDEVSITHEEGAVPPPGNCSNGLGFPTDCLAPGNPYEFGANSQIARMSATTWYVGNNGRAEDGGRSLYRARLAPGATVLIEEVVPGVTDMQLRYREVDAANFIENPNWPNVTAVEYRLTLRSTDSRVSTDSANEGRLDRDFTTIIGLRNRVE